jgi:hypothetical protein
MSSKPKKQNYQATAQEKTQAAVAKAEKDYFDQTYAPLLREMRDISEREDLGGLARGTSQADTMQALTGGRPSLAAATSVDRAADIASGAVAQQVAASSQGLAAQRQRQIGVLGTARGQAADAQAGLAQAARTASTKQLQAARAKQQIRDARFQAGLDVGSAFAAQGLKNLGSYDTKEFKDREIEKPGFFTRFLNPSSVYGTEDSMGQSRMKYGTGLYGLGGDG